MNAAPWAVVSRFAGRDDPHAREIRLELHEEVARRGAAVDAELAKPRSRVRLHRAQKVGDLERDAFERGAGEVGPASSLASGRGPRPARSRPIPARRGP